MVRLPDPQSSGVGQRLVPVDPFVQGLNEGSGYISDSSKRLTQLVCMDAPSAMIVDPQT
jgi:hypothetical protein